MKKALLVLVFIGLILPMTCLATEGAPVDELIAIIERIQGIISTILVILAAVFIVVAGFFFVTAGGDPNMVGKARQMLIFALVGVAVAAVAHFLVELVGWLVEPPESPAPPAQAPAEQTPEPVPPPGAPGIM